MRIELQLNSQLGAMDVMTRAQKDFAVLFINRQIQNRVLSAFDTNLQMLQGSQLSPGTAEQSLTNCLAETQTQCERHVRWRVRICQQL